MLQYFIRHAVVAFSLSTLGGSFVHGTHIDAAATVAATANVSVHALASESHTHVERISGAVRGANQSDARITPRETKYRKYLLQNRVARGHHAFDNYSLPMV